MATSAARSKVPDSKVLRGLGILALVGIGGAHFEYWYRMLRMIPTSYSLIGPLFMFTFIFAWVLAIAMLVFPRSLIAVVAALFSFATLGGYILSLELPHGVFEYKDPGISYSGGIAIGCEVIVGLALLAWGGSRLLGARTAKTSSVPFGATAADAPTGAKAPKPAKTPKPAKAGRKTKESVPFGATAEDLPTQTVMAATPQKAGQADKAASPAASYKPAKPTKPGRGRNSVQAQIEQAEADFKVGASPPYGRR